MEKLRIKKHETFKIEVNDDGEYIEFDLEDASLNFKCANAMKKLKELEKELKLKEENLIKELKETPKSNNEDFIIEIQYKLSELEQESFTEARKIMDSFLGEGACQKIFGDRNSYAMFDLLFEELSKPREELEGKSYFDKMKLTSNDIKDKIKNKYNKTTKKVI